MTILTSVCVAIWTWLSLSSLGVGQSLPTVDLGYQVQRASSFNSTGQFYNFSNIRYAQPPIGELRWAPPVSPTGRNTTTNDGTSFGPICPQAIPGWIIIAEEFVASYVLGTTDEFNYTSALEAANKFNATYSPSSGTSEDCLFLDIFVPKSIFDSSAKRKRSGGAPVLVWVYGGGYTEGSKVANGSPAGIIKASQANETEGVIVVAMNYRLGAFGWLSGPTFSTNGTQNLGLYDQRLALEWVQEHIGKFGGDPNRVTVIGESAGGGSIFHQITAFAGQKPVPFQQAVLQSAAWLPTPSGFQQELVYQEFLGRLNVSTLEEARQLPSEVLQEANYAQIAAASYGTFVCK
ncbi:putative carboxylesterase family protein [Phaeomoniella chlamydospora]|uniref:Carboxylic ester hydrolase n=1 Tax=Phaeomoniella chlamydospora TaxID=158046 RepID=A0A0G2GHY7_PHACM|nr:putative carboxylesterase family protein [Phaeomoniella chlamydospora]